MASVEIKFNEEQIKKISDSVAAVMRETLERYESGEDNDILVIFQRVRDEEEHNV